MGATLENGLFRSPHNAMRLHIVALPLFSDILFDSELDHLNTIKDDRVPFFDFVCFGFSNPSNRFDYKYTPLADY